MGYFSFLDIKVFLGFSWPNLCSAELRTLEQSMILNPSGMERFSFAFDFNGLNIKWQYLSERSVDFFIYFKSLEKIKDWRVTLQLKEAQVFSINALSPNAFSLKVLTTFTAIYSQSIVNMSKFFTDSYQRKQISRKGHRIYWDQLIVLE